MLLYMLGLDYHVAPVDAGEPCRSSPEGIRTCLTTLIATRGLPLCFPQAPVVAGMEVVILSTSRRLEIYAATEGADTEAMLRAWLLQTQCLAQGDTVRHLNHRRNREAVEHLLRVASSLEPSPLGEPYILEQLIDALALARECGAAGPLLAHIFSHAIEVGKRADVETDIGSRAIFLRQAAVGFLSQRYPELAKGNLLIVGASKMAHVAVHALRYMESQPTAFINRTAAEAEVMEGHGPGQVFPWYQMRAALAWADVVVAAAAALYPVLDAGDIAAALGQRRGRPLLLIDLGIPHNVHPAAAGMENIVYYDLEDLRAAATDVAHTEMTRVDAPGPWVASLPVVERMVQAEATALWGEISGH